MMIIWDYLKLFFFFSFLFLLCLRACNSSVMQKEFPVRNSNLKAERKFKKKCMYNIIEIFYISSLISFYSCNKRCLVLSFFLVCNNVVLSLFSLSGRLSYCLKWEWLSEAYVKWNTHNQKLIWNYIINNFFFFFLSYLEII